MEEPLSKFEHLLVQIAEWKARFLHEREWRESIETEKRVLDEKYVQIVFELGAQKRTLENLETQVRLLGRQKESPLSDQKEAAAPKEHGPSELVTEQFDEHEKLRQSPRHATSHHIYTNPTVYESLAFHIHSSRYYGYRDITADGEEPAPYAFHQYQAGGPHDSSPRPPEGLDTAPTNEEKENPPIWSDREN